MKSPESTTNIPVEYDTTETSVRVDNEPASQKKSPEEIRSEIEQQSKTFGDGVMRVVNNVINGEKSISVIRSKKRLQLESDLREAEVAQNGTDLGVQSKVEQATPSVSTNKFEPLSDQEILDSRGSWAEPNSEDK
ncbi:MAG TPA: hypothetical protein PLZ58_03040 [Candidatus Saccharibacteria bacterium]|nr:hypothetical protein [Candidatus Saccharibacteria bacterium]HRQ06953.1 hypothetical protein [Candidatus Saccharibacteria bacterium]